MKTTMIRKGYILVVLFSISIATLQSLEYRIFTKRDLSEITIINLLLQIGILFLAFSIPGLLLVRWYYKIKDRSRLSPSICSCDAVRGFTNRFIRVDDFGFLNNLYTVFDGL